MSLSLYIYISSISSSYIDIDIINPLVCVDVLTFDNSYSWFHSKEVFYCVKVVPPELSETTPTQTGSNAELEADVNEHRHSP